MGLKQRYDVYELKQDGYDAFNTPLYKEELFKTLEMIIVPKDFKIVKDGIQYVESKYLGLTVDKSLKKGMKIRAKKGDEEYEIENVNNIARLAQITLKVVEVDG